MNQLIEYLGTDAYNAIIGEAQTYIKESYPEYQKDDHEYIETGEDYLYLDMYVNGSPCEVRLEYKYEATFEPYRHYRGTCCPDIWEGGEIDECKITPITIDVFNEDTNVTTTLDFINQTITNN